MVFERLKRLYEKLKCFAGMENMKTFWAITKKEMVKTWLREKKKKDL